MKQSKVEREEREKQQKKKKYINVIFYIPYTKPYNPRFIWRPRDVRNPPEINANNLTLIHSAKPDCGRHTPFDIKSKHHKPR